MPILLCAATEFEIRQTIEFIKDNGIKELDVLITGVGLMAATYQITKALATHRPRLVIQAGIAGCLDENLSLLQVVKVKSESIGDLGAEENGSFRSLFDLKFLQNDEFPWKNKKLLNEGSLLEQNHLRGVDAVTISEITTSESRIAYYRNELGAQVESMEGAALHYVCLEENIPFLQIRSLSNFVGERNKKNWLINEAIATLNSELQRVIKLAKQ